METFLMVNAIQMNGGSDIFTCIIKVKGKKTLTSNVRATNKFDRGSHGSFHLIFCNMRWKPPNISLRDF
jgi:hypothetical protein